MCKDSQRLSSIYIMSNCNNSMDKDLPGLLERAAEICLSAHKGQRDKSGRAYFMHPMRVALRCKTDEERIVALLHDVVEDSHIGAEELRNEGFPENIVEAVMSVTHKEGEEYDDFVARAAQNRIGREVKKHDLEDNLDTLRLESIDETMRMRFNRYLKAFRFLTKQDY